MAITLDVPPHYREPKDVRYWTTDKETGERVYFEPELTDQSDQETE